MKEILKERALKLGIIGGGQLSWLLSQSALRVGAKVFVYSISKSDPVFNLSVQACESLEDLVAKSDKVIFENEFVDLAALDRLSAHTKFFPKLESLEIFQDKLFQKNKLKGLGIPSAEYLVYEEGDLLQWIERAVDYFSSADLVFKWSRFGYDGKGNFVFSGDCNVSDLVRFLEEGKNKTAHLYVEEKIQFTHELAASVCRLNGQKAFLPLVLSEQRDGICWEVLGPATSLGISAETENLARDYLARASDAVNLEGCLAAEFFICPKRGLLVNELAPRVHNSAHYSSDVLDKSQFDLQVETAMGRDQKDPRVIFPYFGMKNLLGPESADFSYPSGVFDIPVPNAKFYWYGKSELRKGRKMGHINFWADDLESFHQTKLNIYEWEKSFWRQNQKN